MSTLSAVSRGLSKLAGVLLAGGVAVEHQQPTQNDAVPRNVMLEMEENDAIVIVNPKAPESDADDDKPPAFDEYEIDSAMNSMASSRRGALLDSFLPPQFNDLSTAEQDRALSHILQGVRNVLSDPVLSHDITLRAKKAVNGGDFLKTSLHHQPPPLHYDQKHVNVTQSIDRWENLIAEHPCLICCDLLAAPVIAQCGHSFCGVCITDYVSSVEKNEEVDVEHMCPACREFMPPNRLTYERHLDGIIEGLVDRIPPCEQVCTSTSTGNHDICYISC